MSIINNLTYRSEYNAILSTETQCPHPDISTYESYVNPKMNKVATSVEILERVRDNKKKLVDSMDIRQNNEEKSFWSSLGDIFNPFKCEQNK